MATDQNEQCAEKNKADNSWNIPGEKLGKIICNGLAMDPKFCFFFPTN